MNWLLWSFSPDAPGLAFIQMEVSGTEVLAAFEEARKHAIKQLGSEDILCLGWNWSPGYLCAVWQLPPPPQEI